MFALALYVAAGSAPQLPTGWHALQSIPDQAQFDCVIHGDAPGNWWHVDAPGDVARITALADQELDDAMPFKTNVARPGRRHALHVSGGWLVGFDAGEFGGSFWWFSEDGTRRKELRLDSEQRSWPVTGMAKLSSEVLVAQGSGHEIFFGRIILHMDA